MPTRRYQLTSEWQEIGQGPLMVEAETNQAVLVHFSDTIPSTPDAPAHQVNRGTCITYEDLCITIKDSLDLLDLVLFWEISGGF